MTKTELIALIHLKLKDMTPDERIQFWIDVAEGYCNFCGTSDPKNECQCWHDE